MAALLVMLVSAAGAAAQTTAPLSTAAPMLEELVKQAQDTSLPEADRVAVVRLLAEWGTAQVREPLVALLKDQLPSIREWAGRGLGWQGNSEAVAALVDRVEAPGETPAVRAAALESLGSIGEESARKAVLAATADPDPRVRGAALGAVTTGLLASPADRLPLLRQVARDSALNPLMRCQAIAELGKAKDGAAIPLLTELLANGPRIAMPLLAPSATQQEVMAVRFRQSRDIRAWAARSLGALEAKEALPLLLTSAEDPDDYFLRLSSIEVLLFWRAPEALPVLVRRLEDPFTDNRALALVGLARAGDRSVADAVLARLSDPAPVVRAQAVSAIAVLGDPRARAELESLRKRELDANVQLALEAALARLAR